MNNQLENAPVQKVLLSEKIDRFTNRILNAPRKSINEQFIMAKYDSHLADILFFTIYFGTETNQPLLGVALYALGIFASTSDYYHESKNLPESRKPHSESFQPVI